MKVKLAMLVGNEALQKLVDAPMPTATSFRVAKAVKEVQKELEVFEEQRQALLGKIFEIRILPCRFEKI